MRIPISKIYRAFPELDKFSDEVCEQYVIRARNRRMGSGCVTTIIAAIAAIGSAVAMSGCLGFVVVPIAVSLGIRIGERYQDAAAVFSLIVLIAGAIMVGFLVRDTWLRRAIRSCLDAARCAMCDYSLLGLPVRDGAVTCPECGTALNLSHAGLSPEDVLSRAEPA